MITVIIAGGSGTRLWPLSTPAYPKHLLKLTGERTMLQTTYDRAVKAGKLVYVVTEASHSKHVREQLPDLPDDAFLIEPGRRGTGNCIVFALDIISRKHDHKEPIAFVHSDHHIRDTDGYVQSLHNAADASNKTHKITLVGIEPTFPSTLFGYIERDGLLADDTDAYVIQSFKEKPDYDTAQQYVQAGNYLWNCGYFVGSFDTFLSEINRSSPELKMNYEKLMSLPTPCNDKYSQTYLKLDNQVIDYALSEKSDNLLVVPANFDWMDMGSFRDLHNAVDRDEQGNYFNGKGIYSIDVGNVYVRNEETKPIAVIGLDNVIVVNTPEGILVARKDVSNRVGEIAKKLQAKGSKKKAA
jgi:mannose-1-phosphate guanylyltransferase/mannose-6-phosphate isomerase